MGAYATASNFRKAGHPPTPLSFLYFDISFLMVWVTLTARAFWLAKYINFPRDSKGFLTVAVRCLLFFRPILDGDERFGGDAAEWADRPRRHSYPTASQVADSPCIPCNRITAGVLPVRVLPWRSARGAWYPLNAFGDGNRWRREQRVPCFRDSVHSTHRSGLPDGAACSDSSTSSPVWIVFFLMAKNAPGQRAR